MINYIILLIKIFLTFVKVSLFNFGGGFVMISLIRDEIISHGWLSGEEFNNVIAISQMTPGAIAINTATYIGYQVAGIFGAVIASLAIPIPSFVIVIVISPIILKYKEHTLNKMIFYGIRPVVVALILNAAIIVAKTPFYKISTLSLNNLLENINLFNAISLLNLGSIFIFIFSLLLILKYKINPIFVIIISAFLGILIFSF